jgi:hypothetical protein
VKILLHIGTEKTGSTSIQRFLRRNRERLPRHGFATSTSLGPRSHVALAVMSLGDRPTSRLHKRLGLATRSDVEQYRRDRTAALRAELAAYEDATVLLSCEQLSFLPNNQQKVQRLCDWLHGFSEDIRVLVYLRRQDSMLVALYSQELKSGRTAPLEVPGLDKAGAGSKYDYLAMIDRWSQVVGADRVQPRVFERGQLVGGDVIEDYLDAIGLGASDEFDYPDERNPSLDAAGMEFLRLFNQHVPDRRLGPNAVRGDIASLLTARTDQSRRMALPAADARAFVDRFAPGNASIARDFLHRADGVLFRDGYADGSDASPPLTVERAVEISAGLWVEKQSQLLRLQRRSDAPRHRRARARGLEEKP